LAPILAFYMLRDIDHVKERFVRSLPARYRQDILALLRALDRVLAGFVRGQMLLALLVGSLAATATALLGFRYPILLGIWAGLTEFIPYVGPVLGAIPAVLAGLSVSPLLALETVLAFAIIQQLENAVLSPRIMGHSVGLHPLVVLFAVLASGYLVGGWGLILALPVTGLLRVLWCFFVARLTAAPPPLIAAPAARPEHRDPPGHE
jgi:predicted PurR-regulated permease PerM